MTVLIEPVRSAFSLDLLCKAFDQTEGFVALRSGLFNTPHARYSILAAAPFLTMRAYGASCQFRTAHESWQFFGDPWSALNDLMARYELLDQIDHPFPLGGCFGFWGYELKNFVEPRSGRTAVNDLETPDCHLGFYDSLLIVDHQLQKCWIVSTGLDFSGRRSPERARDKIDWWRRQIENCATQTPSSETRRASNQMVAPESNIAKAAFLNMIERAQRWIRSGDIYQVNLAQRFAAPLPRSSWSLFESLSQISPAPFAAFLNCGGFEVVSSSPELFLRMSGQHIITRPIKGTRPRSHDPDRDAQLMYELQTSPKEMAELVMITDLLRNDLGRISEYGTVRVPELARLEKYAVVQHLVSTVESTLRSNLTHAQALASCFPGGSVTGAPKIRAMQIIDELETEARGPYTGAIGYLGFNRESQLSIAIRTAICLNQTAYFYAGAGIVADSIPEAEYDETLAKAAGFFRTLELQRTPATASV